MNKLKGYRFAAILTATVVVTGCSGIKPYDPPDYKEEPPGSGLLTGKDGEFAITIKNEQESAPEEKQAK
ncbi:MAG: hypothetical protein AB1Z51_00175 [Desulfuromonadales bacterium]